MFIEINTEALTINRNIVIGVIYITPNTNIKDFNAQIVSVLEELRIDIKLVYLIRDYNIDLLNSDSHDLTLIFTLIDNIFTNNHDDLNCSSNGILVADISDHFPIFHVNCSFTVEETGSCLVTRRL